jgi:hypothetical protein
MPGKKGLWGLKMLLLRRRNTTSLTKFPSFDTSYKPQLFGTNKTPYLRSNHSEKIHIQKSRKKKQA